jgi:hypothetical protein
MKKTLNLFLLFIVISVYGQEKPTFFGGFESNAQWYLNDKALKVGHPESPIRSNNYLFLNSKYKKFSAGIQIESYEQKALLNFNPGYKNTNFGTYFLQYQDKKIDLTAGYFYEQFGSGLLFRGWEDRSLGINNALRGGRAILKPSNYLTLKAIYGQQRSGFEVANSKIYGADLELVLSDVFKFKTTEISLGFSYVGRDQRTNITNLNFNALTNAFATRLNFSNQSFYASTEFNYKSNDAVVQQSGQPENDFIKPGSALLLNVGYSKKGFGLDGSFRRLENMSFFSERSAKGNTFNDKILNFMPSLTKQHHYNLANIYVYQSQPNVILADISLVKAGEIGGQLDVFYDFKKGSKLGGKYGTKLAFNFSNWNALGGNFQINNPKAYQTDFFGFGKKYFSDYNLEITKKWNAKWQTIFAYINQHYNKKLIEETVGLVKTNILAAEATYKITASKSVRVVAEHLWADADKKNWASSTAEFNINPKWSVFGSDMYNYGNDNVEKRHHYYNFGTAYRKSATRVSLSYGRQRGGLICVGGVCRIVPESSGVALSFNTSF